MSDLGSNRFGLHLSPAERKSKKGFGKMNQQPSLPPLKQTPPQSSQKPKGSCIKQARKCVIL